MDQESQSSSSTANGSVLAQAAVEREDFDAAKALKQDVDKLRAAGEGVALGRSEAPPRRAPDPEQIFNRALNQAPPPPPMPADVAPAGDERPASASGHFDNQPVGGAAPHMDNMRPSTRGYDEPEAAERVDVQALLGEADAPDPPPGFTPDLPVPAPLGTADANDGDALTSAFGEYVARCMYSKNWAHRAAAFKYLSDQVANGSLKDYKLLVKYLQKGLHEKVAALVLECGALIRAAIHKGGKLVSHLAQALLPIILERLGDGNARIADTMNQVLLDLANSPDSDPSSMMGPLLRPHKKASVWRPLLVRLSLLEALVPKFRVNQGKDSFELPELMAFVGAGFSNANGDVRAAAVRVTVAAFKEVGQAVTRYIPADINPKVKQQIFEAIGLEPEAAPAPAVPETPKAVPNGARRNARAAPHAAPPAAPPGKPGAKGKEKAKPKSGFAANLPSLANGHSPSPQPSPEPLDPENPQVVEEQLAQKERDLGPSHPEVADCLSNLAILYNQRGEQRKALPLYERALAIFEATRGRESQDVAHTLTDLAVLHLEQGREDIGRPLLERALAIQQKTLGPDHPDVTAILDVLHGDDA